MEGTEILQGQNEKYRIAQRRPFAYGRISVLYEGVDEQHNAVCLKLYRDMPTNQLGNEAYEEFITELKAQSSLKHHNIIHIIDFGSSSGDESGPFVVYPLCTGGNLREFCNERSYIPLVEALQILEQIAKAIDFAHSSGFIHGDIKPENVLFPSDRYHVLLADFGISRFFPIEETVATTAVGIASGTTAYLSPEQIEHNRQNTRSDLYSFGLLAYELLTGRLPFNRDTPLYSQMKAKIEGNLIDISDANPKLPPAVAKAFRSILNTDGHQRPESASTFCRMLRGEKVTIGKPSIRAVSNPLDPRIKVALITAVIGAIAAIIVAAIKVLPELLK